MPQPSECLALERFRDYLIILARIRIPSDLRVRIDPSDLVQDTLFCADRDRGQFRGQTEAEMAGLAEKDW